MGRILLGSAALAAVTLPIWARAEDRPAQWDKAATAISAYDWSGFYLGAHVGYMGGASNWSATQPGGGSNIGGSLDLFQPLDAFTQDGSFLGGIQAGYNIMLPSRAVAGVEADVSFPGMIGAGQNFATPIVGAANYNDALEMFGTVRGRFGYDVDGWLYYATSGLAWSYDQFTRTQLTSGLVGAASGTIESKLAERVGWTAGAGIEAPIAPGWTAKLEYLYTQFGDTGVSFPLGGQRFDSDLSMHEVRWGVSYRPGLV